VSAAPIDVAAALVFHEGRLLIAQRRAGDHLGGLWEFPGGKVEPGESFAECLARELAEECGLTIGVGEEIEDVVHRYPEKTVHLKFFRCWWVGGEARPLGCAAVAWVDRAELAHHSFPAADARLIDRLTASEALWATPMAR